MHTATTAALALLTLSTLPAQKGGVVGKFGRQGRLIKGAVALTHKFKSSVLASAMSHDGRVLVVRTADNHLHFKKPAVWLAAEDDEAKTKAKATDRSFEYRIDNMFFAKDGERLLGRINASTLAILTSKPRILHHLKGMPGVVVASLHPDGKRLVAGMTAGLLRVWDTTTGKPIRYFTQNEHRPTWVGFTPNGKSLVVATDDRKLRYFQFQDFKAGNVADTGKPWRGRPSLSANGQRLLVIAGDKLQLWNIVGGKLLKDYAVGEGVERVVLSPSALLMAVAFRNGAVALYRTQDGEAVERFTAHPDGEIVGLHFLKSNRGQLLVTAAPEDGVIYWDLAKLAAAAGKGKKGRKSRKGRKR